MHIGAVLLRCVVLTLHLLVHCMFVYYRVYAYVPKLPSVLSPFRQTIYAFNLSLSSLTCSFLWKCVGGVLVCGRLLLAIVFLETSFYGVTTT